MINYEEQLVAEDGLKLHVYRYFPENANAALLISHGWSEHAGRYHELAIWFAQHGFEVHALDHRGHGKSEGVRGHVNAWSEYTRDLEMLRKTVKQDYQYLLGHSMGGMIAALHLLEYPDVFKAAVLSGPASDVSYKVPAFKKILGQLMSSWYPSLALKNKVDPNIVCGNQEVVDAYINDPLNHGQVSARWFNDYLKQIERLKRDAGTIKTPVAIWHGEKDELVAPWVGKQLFEGLACEGKQFHTVGDALHEILFEHNWRDIAGQMKTWLERH